MNRSPSHGGVAGDGIGPGAASLAEASPQPHWYEAGEVLWLAAQRWLRLKDAQRGRPRPGRPVELPEAPEVPKTPETPEPAEVDRPRPEDVDAPVPDLMQEPVEHPVPVNGPPAQVADPGAHVDSLLMSLGNGSALDRSREIEKALEPLKRRIASRSQVFLNEEATAELHAETGVWLPQLEAGRERWLTVTLLVDSGDSMRLWSHTAQRLAETLHCSGAFRDVRTVRWQEDGGEPVSDTEGRHLVLVLTDLHADHWGDGSARRRLARWARTMPVALVHVLPEHVWARAGTQTSSLLLTSPRPAAPNSTWKAEPVGLVMPTAEADGPDGTDAPDACDGVRLPVVTLTPEGLGGLARFLAHDTTGGYTVRVLDRTPGDETAVARRPAAALPADIQVKTVRAQLSPTAYHLARLSAAVPLNLDVLRLLQEGLIPGARNWHVAELLLSGLLQRTEAEPGESAGPGVELEFGEGVRRELLSDGTRGETARALMLALDHLAVAVPAYGEGVALLREPDRARSVSMEGLRPWISSILPAFAAMAGPHATAARELEARLDEPPPPVATPSGEPSRFAGGAGPTAAPPDTGNEVPDTGNEERVEEVSGLQSTQAGSRGDALQKPPPVWGNVPPRNRAFTGRVQLLEDLHRRLQEGTTAVLPEALQGMGGVGKSQLAVEYVYRHLHEYQVVWWIPAEQTQQIRQALVNLASRLGLSVGSGEANTAVPAVIEALRIGEPFKNWLLIFDNAEDPESVREFFPTNGPGRILVTSRNAQWSSSARPLEVDVFTREESRSLLQMRAPNLDDATADRLAETLGDLPLGIEQAAVWLAETGMPADEYLRMFEQQANELMLSDPPVDYPLSVAAAWNVSLDRLRKNHPAALQLLQVCAFFAPEPISRRLLTGVRDAPVPPELNAALSDPIRLGRAIREINRYALARINHNTNTIQLHRLVQRVLITQMSEPLKSQMRGGAHRLLAKYDPDEPAASHQWKQYGDLLPHVLNSRAVESKDPWVRQLVLNEIQYMFSWGDHQGSLDLAREAYTTWREADGDTAEHVLNAAKLYTNALRILGRYSEAYELDQRTLAGMTEVLGPEHESTIDITSMVAWDLRLRGDFQAALELDKHAYETCERLFGPNDPATLVTAHRHALNLRCIGHFRAALALDRMTHSRKAEELGENAASTLGTMASVTFDLQEGGEYLAARDQARDVEERFRNTLGDTHPNTISAIRVLSVAERRAGQHDLALELSSRALLMFRTRYGSLYPQTVNALASHAIDVRHSGDLARALELGQEGYEGYEALLGPRHPHSVAGRVNHAICLRLAGRTEEARAANVDAREQLTELIGEDHPNTLSCTANLVADLFELGEMQASVELATRSLDLCRTKLGEDHPITLATALNLSLGLRQLQRDDEADELYADTAERYRRTLGENHPATTAAADGRPANCDIDPLLM
ncbi:FxSxx-COOH system tetratricopeptide repeat protein [Streptomyces sp. NPDC048641]|uniref:FxSxx-COOH system tetratricopeptide repeat protein n=1 Tax=Streptomyces sp. NPDC048641 TaxID=3154825 RepID=UPI00341211DC